MNNISGVRKPYRVQDIQKDKSSDQDSQGQFFDQNEEHSHQKFLKASEKLYKKKSVVLASEIMTKQLVSLEGVLSAEEAWERIKDHTFKYFPILNEEGKLLGMLSEKEILKGVQEKKGKKLQEIAAKQTLCAEPETHLAEILKVFSEQEVEAVPVVDHHHHVVGMLTQNDLLQTMLRFQKSYESS